MRSVKAAPRTSQFDKLSNPAQVASSSFAQNERSYHTTVVPNILSNSLTGPDQRSSEVETTVCSFEANVSSVRKLINFDHEVVELTVKHVKGLHESLVRLGYDNASLNARNTLTMLQGIKDHDSLLPRYRIIFNQAVVLLVSYFGSAIHDLFKTGVSARLLLDDDNSNLMREELKLSFRNIRERGWVLNDIAADLLVEKKDFTFQDMKSISEAFETYVGIRVARDKTVNNIIVAQACRHVIVHAGHEVTPKMIHQLRDAKPRDVKPNLQAGELVQFSPAEVELVGKAMQTYVSALADCVKGRLTQG